MKKALQTMALVLPAVLSAVMLVACKSAPRAGSAARPPARPLTAVERQLASVMGADISAVIGILGFPDEKRQSGAGLLVYAWASDRSSRLPMSEIRMGSYPEHAGGGGPCRVELTADDHGRVAGYTWSGTDALCGWVLRAFNRAEFEEEAEAR